MKRPFLFIVRMSYLVIPSSLSAQIMERRRYRRALSRLTTGGCGRGIEHEKIGARL